MKRLTLLLAIFFCFCCLNAQESVTGRYARFLTPVERYVAYRVAVTPEIDGILSDKEWKNAPWTNLFTDISGDGHPTPRFDTRAKILWDDDYLYVAAQLEEPDVWAYIKERDEIIYYDNDFEIFLDPDNDGKNYFEMEFNALATVFDLFIEHPYRSPESSFITIGWNASGLRVATHVDGTLNDNSDRDRGWTIEVAIPRKAVNDGITNILQAGNIISVGFSRVEWQTDKLADGGYSVRKNKKGGNLPEDNWTWGANGRVAMHMPERWGKVYLSTKKSGDVFPALPDEDLMRILWAMFYREEEEFGHNHRYINEIPYADVILAEGLWAKYDHKIHHRWRDENGNVREYPGADYCYCDACCADFLIRTGIDIRKEIASGVDPASIPEWAQFRCDVLTDLVNTICDSLHAQGCKVSADVFPGPEGYAEPMVRQQWKKWDVDMFFPMNYNDFYLEDAEWVGEITRVEAAGTLKPVVSGLFICHDWKNKDKITDPEGSGLTPSELKTAIEGSMSSGAAAICLFTPDRMTPEHWEVFEKVVKGGVRK
ncbi:MAG: carbohydrate-binding family 9-like protein [Bacteroidia bacterium]|nr:carbohydrate-binding family 9-like protein [Bacteroidia bacterium]